MAKEKLEENFETEMNTDAEKETDGASTSSAPEEPDEVSQEETDGASTSSAPDDQDAEQNVDAEPVEASTVEEDQKTSKKNKKKKSKEQEKIEELEDRVKRQMAEFENFRKRTEKEKTQKFDMGVASAVEKILPVVDNFERGLAALSEEEKKDPFAEGMEKIYKQLIDTLTEIGVEPIEAQGAEFDPELHNAVMHIEDDSLGENVVAQELQKGYKYHDTVIRHSMVQVAN